MRRDHHDLGWPPDAAGVSRAAGGDDAAFSAILADGIRKLVGFYRALGLTQHDAEDLAADAAESVVRNIGRLRDPQAFEAWFWRIGRNKFHDHIRSRRRHDPDPRLLAPEPIRPDEAVQDGDDQARVRAAFATLTLRDQELLWLREVVGLAYREIAGRLRSREGAVRVAVMRAKNRLQEALAAAEAASGQAAESPIARARNDAIWSRKTGSSGQ